MVFSLSTVKQQVISNTASQLITRLVGSGCGFVVSLLIARYLGAIGYGDYSKITNFVAPFYLFVDFGWNALFIKFHDGDGKHKSFSWQLLLGLRLITAILLMFLCISILAFIPSGANQGYTPWVKVGIILFSLTILSQSILTTCNAIFQLNLTYWRTMIASVIGSTVEVIGVLASVLVFQPGVALFFVIISVGLGNMIMAAVCLWNVKKEQISLSPAFDPTAIKTFIIASLPLGATLFFNLIYFRADSFVLTLTRSTYDVGIYGFAYKLFEFPLVFPTFMMNALYPLLVKSSIRKDAGDVLKKRLKISNIVLLLLSLVFIFVYWIASPYIVLIKPEFADSIAPLRILSLGLPFFFLSSVSMWGLITLEKHHVLAFVYGIGMVLTILADCVYIPKHGYMAASWITVISEACVTAISFGILQYTLHHTSPKS